MGMLNLLTQLLGGANAVHNIMHICMLWWLKAKIWVPWSLWTTNRMVKKKILTSRSAACKLNWSWNHPSSFHFLLSLRKFSAVCCTLPSTHVHGAISVTVHSTATRIRWGSLLKNLLVPREVLGSMLLKGSVTLTIQCRYIYAMHVQRCHLSYM